MKPPFALACALAAATALAVGFARHELDRGDVEATGREFVDVGRHIELIVEPGARVSYTLSARAIGAATERLLVEQRAGRVLYRVDSEASVAVRTRFGAVNAGAASFVVDVAAPDQGHIGVFDGAVAVADATRVTAGNIAETEAGAAPRVHPPLTRADDELLGSIDAVPGPTLVELRARLAQLRAEREALAAAR